MSNLLYKSWTKGTTAESGPPRRSANWAVARRGWFKIFPNRVECGDWVITADSVQDAVLYEYRQWFMPVHVLAIVTAEHTWHFGFNPWSRASQFLPFAFRRERVRIRHSWFSLAVRGIVVAYVLYWLWGKFHA